MLTPETLTQIQNAYDQGLYLQAFRFTETYGPFQQWQGKKAGVLAGRLAGVLGNRRLSRYLLHRTYKSYPTDPETSYYYIYTRLDRIGPLEAWERMQAMGDWPDAEAELRSDWFSLKSQIACMFRDYTLADQLMEKSLELATLRPWHCVVQSSRYEHADQYEEALEWAERGLKLNPNHRASVLQKAVVLRLLDRTEEAREFLIKSTQHLEVGTLYALLAMIEHEQVPFNQEAIEPSRKYVDQYVGFSPLLDRPEQQWVHRLKADLAYHEKDYEKFKYHAGLSKDPFYEKTILPRLEEQREKKRMVLRVPFIRQHHNTCAPATLAALAMYWNRPDVEHLRLAADICYNGTYDHAERHWAETNGWIAREFTIQWEITRQLIDRGIPFTMTTVDPGAGHLQAVVGYDSLCGTLLIRDPASPLLQTMDAEKGLSRYEAFGPRGMLLLPAEEVSRLDEVTLPDEELYTRIYQLKRALEKHDRQQAQIECNTLKELAPNHRLRHWAERHLAIYDENQEAHHAANQALLELSPENSTLRLSCLSTMAGLSRRTERLARLHQYTNDADADPLFGQMLAAELMSDASQHALSEQLLRRSIRTRPTMAGSYSTLAELYWNTMRRKESLTLYRMAASLNDKEESYLRNYFEAALALGESETVLTWLKQRQQQLISQSSQPVCTLHWALDRLNRHDEANQVLTDALTARPDDTELLLFAAETTLQRGELDRCQSLIEKAMPRASRTACLRQQAHLFVARNQLPEALDCWERILEIDPLSQEAHRNSVRLIAELNNKEAAVTRLNESVARYPHHYGLKTLRIDWLRDHREALLAAVRQMHEQYPDDAWTCRELAYSLNEPDQLDEALRCADDAVRLDPFNPASLALRAHVLALRKDFAEASAQYLAAIKLDIDYSFGLEGYVELAESHQERQSRLLTIAAELNRQLTQGEGIQTFHRLATHTLDAPEILEILRLLWQKRPELWATWDAYIEQLIAMADEQQRSEQAYQQYLNEALEIAHRATLRFPLLPVMWLDLARVNRLKKDTAQEIAALQQALRINPNWSTALRDLASAYQRDDQLDNAEKLLRESIARSPLEPMNHARLGDLLSRRKQTEKALECYRQSIILSPGFEYGWEGLRQLAEELKQDELPCQMARDLAARRPREARSWLILADTLTKPEHLEERLQALHQAIALNPSLSDAYDKKAVVLAEAGRFDEAHAVCQQNLSALSNRHLQGRKAWIHWQQGNQQQAIQDMESILEKDPDYAWACFQLLQWLRTLPEEKEKCLKRAQRCTEQFPRNPIGFGYLGDILMSLGRKTEAKQAYAHAVQLDDSSGYALMNLFDEQLADGDDEEAAETLKLLKKESHDAFVAARVVQLACRSNSAESMREAEFQFHSICLNAPRDNNWPIDAATEALWEANRTAILKQTLLEVVKLPDVHPYAVVMLIRVIGFLDGLDWAENQLVNEKQRNPALTKQLYEGLFSYLDRKGNREQLHQFVKRHHQSLQADTELWGMTASAMLDQDPVHGARHTLTWMKDYEQRTDAAPEMLLTLILAAIARKEWTLAHQVCHSALALPPDRFRMLLQTWAAFLALQRQELDAVKLQLEAIDVTELNPYHTYVFKLTQASLQSLKNELSLRQFKKALQKAASDTGTVTANRATLVAVRNESIYLVARYHHRWLYWLWVNASLKQDTLPTGASAKTSNTQDEQTSSKINWLAVVIIICIVISGTRNWFTNVDPPRVNPSYPYQTRPVPSRNFPTKPAPMLWKINKEASGITPSLMPRNSKKGPEIIPPDSNSPALHLLQACGHPG